MITVEEGGGLELPENEQVLKIRIFLILSPAHPNIRMYPNVGMRRPLTGPTGLTQEK